MAKRPIILLPDPVLRLKAATIARVDEGVRKLADDMLETMYAAPGVGLDVSDDDEVKKPYVMINPEVVTRSAEVNTHEEGCLSMPEVRVEIERPAKVTVRYLDRDGKAQTLDADGLLATCVQHEIDHLEGRLVIDYMSRLKRDMVIRRFKKLARDGVAD